MTQQTSSATRPQPRASAPESPEACITDGQGGESLRNSQLRKVASDTAGAVQYALASTAAHPEADVPPSSLEATVRQTLQGIDEDRRTRLQQRSADLLKTSPEIRRVCFNGCRAASLEPGAFLERGFRRYEEDERVKPLEVNLKLLRSRVSPPGVSLDHLQQTENEPALKDEGPEERPPYDFQRAHDKYGSSLESMEPADLVDPTGGDGSPSERSSTNKNHNENLSTSKNETISELRLMLTRIKCVDETDPESRGIFSGADCDKMALGGVAIGEKGETRRIGEERIGTFCEDGHEKSLRRRRYATFNLRNSDGQGQNAWPEKYYVNLYLAEKGRGGFADLLGKVYEEVDGKLKEKLEEWTRDGLDELSRKGIENIIVEAAVMALDKIVEWIRGVWGDDIFPPETVHCTIPGPGARWRASSGTCDRFSSPRRQVRFYGHDGQYNIEYYWKVS